MFFYKLLHLETNKKPEICLSLYSFRIAYDRSVLDHAPWIHRCALGRGRGRQPVGSDLLKAGEELLDVDVEENVVERVEKELVRHARLFAKIRPRRLHTELAPKPTVRELHFGRG